MLNFATLLLVGAAAGAAAQKAHPASQVGPHLAQVRTFAAAEGDKVWAGYGDAPFGFLLITKDRETLLCRDAVPSGFAATGTDRATGCKVYTRRRAGMPDNL